MTTTNVGDFLHHLTRGMAAELLGVESDRQLVERVLATRDESALLAIVLRHGTMVYHVCRRVLRPLTRRRGRFPGHLSGTRPGTPRFAPTQFAGRLAARGGPPRSPQSQGPPIARQRWEAVPPGPRPCRRTILRGARYVRPWMMN